MSKNSGYTVFAEGNQRLCAALEGAIGPVPVYAQMHEHAAAHAGVPRRDFFTRKEIMTHQEIANRQGISRQTVGRYIERARREGLVEVQIKSPLLFAVEWKPYWKKFNLTEALDVLPAVEGEDAIKESLGMVGAEFLEQHVQPGDTLGISWGSTVLELGVI